MPKKILIGKVVSDKMDKTRIVLVERIKKHPKYQKQYKTSKKFMARDPKNQSKKDDIVKIIETKPFSKYGRWEIVKIQSSK